MKAKLNLLFGLSFCGSILGLLLMCYGYTETWKLLNIRPMTPHFGDIRVITGAIASHEVGFDPAIENPADPWKRPLNYPKIWKQLYRLGIDDRHATVIGIGLIILFIAGVCLALPPLDSRAVAWLMIAVFSPAVLFGIERGNIDLLMFFLVAVAIFFVQRHPQLSVLSLLLAFVLKLFPVFAVAVLFRQTRATFARYLVGALVFVVLYSAWTFDDLIQVSHNTPRSTHLSYGIDILWMVVTRTQAPMIKLIGRVLSYLGAVLLVVGAWTFTRHRPATDAGADDRGLEAFRAGSAIYLGTFLLGANWDYRLMFLLFTLPQLFRWSGHPSPSVSQLSVLTLFSIYASLWYLIWERLGGYIPHSNYVIVGLDQTFKWSVFAGLVSLFFFSLPDWVRQVGRMSRASGSAGAAVSAA